MAKVYENVHLYDGEESEVAVAPLGSDFQEGVGPAQEPFEDVGWISEDGVSEEPTLSVEPFRAWQGRKIVKRIVTEPDTTFSFQCLEENAVVHGLKYRGARPTKASADATYARTVASRAGAMDQRVWRFRQIADDGSEKVYIFTGIHVPSGTITHQASGLTIHEYQVNPIGDVVEYTDHDAIVDVATVAP